MLGCFASGLPVILHLRELVMRFFTGKYLLAISPLFSGLTPSVAYFYRHPSTLLYHNTTPRMSRTRLPPSRRLRWNFPSTHLSRVLLPPYLVFDYFLHGLSCVLSFLLLLFLRFLLPAFFSVPSNQSLLWLRCICIAVHFLTNFLVTPLTNLFRNKRGVSDLVLTSRLSLTICIYIWCFVDFFYIVIR